MKYYNGIDISEGTDVNKISESCLTFVTFGIFR